MAIFSTRMHVQWDRGPDLLCCLSQSPCCLVSTQQILVEWIMTAVRTQNAKICVPCDGTLRNWDKGVCMCVGWLPWDPEMMLEGWAPGRFARVLQSPLLTSLGHSVSQVSCEIWWVALKERTVISQVLFPIIPLLSYAFPSPPSPPPHPYFLAWCLLFTGSSFVAHSTLCSRRPGWHSPFCTEPCQPQRELRLGVIMLTDYFRTVWALRIGLCSAGGMIIASVPSFWAIAD